MNESKNRINNRNIYKKEIVACIFLFPSFLFFLSFFFSFVPCVFQERY